MVASLCDRYETSAYGESSPADYRLDVTRIDLPDAFCDALLLNHVLDCIPNDGAAITEMHRVLKPGGVVLAVATFAQGVATREIPVLSNSLYRIYGSADLARHFHPFAASAINASEHISAEVRRTSGIPSDVTVMVLRR